MSATVTTAPKQKIQSSSNWPILFTLAAIAVVWTCYARDRWLEIVILMALSYVNNCAYSMVSRSAVRDSATYHAFMMLLSNVVWYSVLHRLFLDNISLVLFVPYTVATVWGSFTGAKASMRVEKLFGITTKPEQKKESPKSLLAKRTLLVVLGVAGIIDTIYFKNFLAAAMVAGMVFAVDVGFSLFVPYCFGSVLGALVGQRTSQWFEKKIGATADKHLSDDAQKFSWKEIFGLLPMRVITVLALLTVACIAFSTNRQFLSNLALFSAGQQIAFSMVSRSRNRDNMTYHIIASIFSNGVWFLTFRQLQVKHWTPELYIPYATAGTIGSVTGVAASMAIEKKLHIAS